ncbi:PKD domain-containing protein [Haloarcula litorea]|uniref:PKD domain-containing protein n=1 Tax=Haloarcula litorea TaxID=3032579 RepID=UPI0023E84C75|nr:PKD domain-containing protein [Halomicroarcula sp. GDY20]
MPTVTGESARSAPSPGRGRRLLVPAVAVAAAAAVLLLVSGPAAAADTTPPEWGNATRVNGTAIAVTVFDDGSGVETGGLTTDQFVLTAGSVEDVSVASIERGNRTGARVVLALERRVGEENVTVGLSSGASIDDAAGNELEDGTVTATGMDAIPPQYVAFGVRRVNGSTMLVRAETREPLSRLRVSVGGASTDRLNRSDFTETVAETAVYTARYTVDEEGEHVFLWLNATDEGGNTVKFAELRTVRYDATPPNVSVSGPRTATVGETLQFSAANSTDDHRVAGYRWRVGSDTILLGPSVRVAFGTPGTREIAVRVTDPAGNAAVVTRTVNVSAAETTSRSVTVSRPNASAARATVSGTGFPQTVRADDGPLTHGRNVSVTHLRAVFPADRTTTLTVRARDGTPDSFAPPRTATGLGTVRVAHGDSSVGRTTFRFTVARAALEAAGADPDAVALYRDGGNWTRLDTTLVNGAGANLTYRAVSPGLSRFVVAAGEPTETGTPTATATPSPDTSDADTSGDPSGGNASAGATAAPAPTPTAAPTPTGSANVTVANASLNASSPSVGDRVTLSVTVANGGTAAGKALVTVFLDESALTSREVSVPAGETRTVTLTANLTAAGPLAVDGERVATVGSGSGLLPGLPNPLALWPDGVVGTVLGAFVGLVVAVYGVLKALAIYLGY